MNPLQDPGEIPPNKITQALLLSHQLLQSWRESTNFDLEVAALRQKLKPDESTLALALSFCRRAFRRQGQLRAILARLAPKPPRAPARDLLQPVLAQILWGDSIPPPLMVDAAMHTAKRVLHVAEHGFINGLLRNAVRSRDELLAMTATVSNLPRELSQAWRQHLPPAEIARLEALHMENAPLVARAKSGAPECPLLEEMDSPAWSAPFRWFVVKDPNAFFAEGWAKHYYVQSPSTALCVYLAQVQPGESAVDMCAAPGGKSLMLAELLGPQGQLTAADPKEDRLSLLRLNLADVTPAPRILLQDATHPSLPDASFDLVLLDVPCSNTGVLRHKPDAAMNFSQAHMSGLCTLQQLILDGAASLTRRGGRLVYATCSIEPRENELAVESFLQRHENFILEEQQSVHPEVLHDGAFAARLRRQW